MSSFFKNSTYSTMKHLLTHATRYMIVFGFLLLGYNAQAQIDLGVNGGANINQLNSPGVYTGLNIGVFASYDIDSSYFGFRAGISYNQLGGGRSDYTDAPESTDFTTTYINRQVAFGNIEAPLFANFYLTKENQIRPRITVGAVYGYNISTTEYRDYRLVNNTTNIYSVYSGDTENVRADFNEHHFDVAAGFGIDFTIANERKAFIEVIYRQGINQMNAVNFGRVGNVGKVYTNSLMLNFGMTLFKL